MDDFPVITTIITTYKRPKLLKRAIQSVLNQTYPHFRICVYDDASGDETGEVVAEMSQKDSRIFYYCNEKNLGLIGNVHQGWEQVRTPYFAHLPDDDIFLPAHFESALDGFRRYPEAMLSANQAISVNDRRQIHKVTLAGDCREGLYEPPEGLLFLIKTDPSILQGAVYRSEVREEIGAYDPDVGQISDWDYVFQIAAKFSYVVNKTPGVIFYMNESGFSGSNQGCFFWPQWLKMFEKIVEHPSLSSLEVKLEVETHLKKRLRSMLVRQGKEAILCEDYIVASQSAQVLNEFFKSSRHCLKLKALAFMCKWCSPYRCFIKFYQDLRLRRKFLKAREYYSEYQKYTSCLLD